MDGTQQDRSRVRITDTLANDLEKYLAGRSRPLEKPAELRDSRIVGLILRREPTGRKSWHYSYQIQGRRGRVKLGSCPALSVEGARKAAMLVAAKVASGADPVAEKRQQRQQREEERARKKVNQEQMLGAFIEGSYKRWAEVTLKSHKATLEVLRADFGDETRHQKGGKLKKGAGWWKRRMDTLTATDFESWRIEELKRGIKPTTINRAWQRLRAVLGKAVEWQVIPGPALRMKKLKTDKRGRVRFLSSDERMRLFSALQERERLRRERRDRFNAWRLARHRGALPRLEAVFTDYLQPLIRTWLGTGLRKTEALLLRWQNLDFEHELVTVPGEIAKSGQSRVVPMPAELKQCLLIWREQKGNPSPDDWVFSRKGQRIRGVYRAWRALTKLAQIKNFRIHDCRHDYASRLAMADVSLQTIAELLGHEDLSMVQRYAHLSQKHLRDSTRRLAPDPMPANIDRLGNLQPGVSAVDNNLPIAA